ncbi:MAG: (Fe-S)-binding protein, partial [Methanosarcinales archaeon]|nr:(Fe-S)-binding protein [Methanosarcinales archaeon]
MASYDCVSLDVIASKIIGLDPMDVPTNKAAIERGYGASEAEVLGIPVDGVSMNFRLSGTTLVGSAPPFLVRRLGKYFTIKPFINTSQCTMCGACVMNCSAHAIEQKKGCLKINHKKCILCYCCRELCPSDAVKLNRSLFARILLKVRNRGR